jgi:iron-sulfur cluster insertion protein
LGEVSGGRLPAGRPDGRRAQRWMPSHPGAGRVFGLSIESVHITGGSVQMNAVAEMPAPLIFTDSAATKVRQLIEEEGNADLKLRVFVQGGGCSGFQYGFTFDEETNEDDTVMEKNGVTLLIDAMSYQYLVGAEIDYKEDIEGAQFVIKNPNATTTCGCGSSFTP